MSTAIRPDGPDFFTKHPKVDPAVGAALDTIINYIISVLNSLDDENVDGVPAIQASKIDLTSGSYVSQNSVLDADRTMTKKLLQAFEGEWRLLRASGNARIREYNGVGVLWGISYNAEYLSGTWQGRDVSDVCFTIQILVSGVSFFYAPAAGAGVVPTWTEIFKIDSNLKISANNISVMELTAYGAGDTLIASADTERSQSGGFGWEKKKEIRITRGGTLRIKFDTYYQLVAGAPVAQVQIYRNGVAVGTVRNAPQSSYSTFSEDISGWSAGDLCQLYWQCDGADDTLYLRNFRIYVATKYGENEVTLN